MQLLGTLGGEWSFGFSINNFGAVTGISDTIWGMYIDEGHAFLWENGHMTDLGTLGGPGSDGEDINDLGQVVGSSYAYPGQYINHACLWANGVMTDLGTLDGAESRAVSINNLGQVVGESAGRAFFWQDGAMTDMNSFLFSNPDWWILQEARDINNAGQIIGKAFNGERYCRFLLTPGIGQKQRP